MNAKTDKKAENNNTKSWYKSKTVWAVIFTVGVTICQQTGVDLPAWVVPSLISAGLLFTRTGRKMLK